MRVAISGTHCCGKSTLVGSFLDRHGDYVHEPEPYEALADLYDEPFAAEPTADDFYRQLEYHIERLHEYRAGDCAIFERSPVDFVAYLLALTDLGRDTADASLAEMAITLARDAVALLDVIVFIQADVSSAEVPAMEDPELRAAVDARLARILLDDELGMFMGNCASVYEATGSTAQRLRIVEHVVGNRL